VAELAERVTADYLGNLERLGVTGIDHFPRATQFIPDIIGIIQGLVAKGFAYTADGDVYFDINRDEEYGKLCHRDPEQLEAGSRVEVNERKRNPGDFALWKGAKPGEPKWDSPWGPGRPGWHIECSAMSMTLLGKTLDIQGGGLDIQFPHHENELAQSESFTGVSFVRYWMHNGLMKIGNDKISKTREEEQRKMAVLGVTELLHKHQPETLRFFLLTTHYRRPIDYGEDRLEEIARAMQGFYRFFERFQRITGASFYELSAPAVRKPFDSHGREGSFLQEVGRLRDAFLYHMDDDFNTGGAIGVLFELLSTLNRFADDQKLETGSAQSALIADFRAGTGVLRELSHLLGVFGDPRRREPGPQDQLLNGLVQLFIDLRAEARKNKNFALADQIRQGLGKLGVTLEDRPGGTGWHQG